MLLRSVLPLSVLFAACGGSINNDNNGKTPPIQQQRTDQAFADQYFVDDINCQTASDANAIGSVPLTFFQKGQSLQVPFAFSGTTNAESLAGPGISVSFYNFYQSQDCGAVGDDGSCGDARVVQDGADLRVCRPAGPYPRTSVEGVALTSLANISTAYQFYQSLPNKSAGLLPSQLLVLPTIEKTYDSQTKRSVATDNLAYAPSFGGKPVFVIYPKGARAAADGLWKNLNLWEMPWGLAHEFGHHVFRTHTKIESLTTGLEGAIPIHSFGFNLAGSRSVSGADIFSAVNEGYADLFAYYVYGAKPGLTQGVDCFQGNREVGDANFATGKAKALTSDVLATFMSTTAAPGGSCGTPNFQDIHAIGAIFAHAGDRIFAAAAPDAGARAQLLLKWAERMGDTVRTTGQAGVTFDVLAKDLLLTAADASGKLPADACAAARDLFPTLEAALLAPGSGLTCN